MKSEELLLQQPTIGKICSSTVSSHPRLLRTKASRRLPPQHTIFPPVDHTRAQDHHRVMVCWNRSGSVSATSTAGAQEGGSLLRLIPLDIRGFISHRHGSSELSPVSGQPQSIISMFKRRAGVMSTLICPTTGTSTQPSQAHPCSLIGPHNGVSVPQDPSAWQSRSVTPSGLSYQGRQPRRPG